MFPGTGLLISEVTGYSSQYLDIECADGRWDWIRTWYNWDFESNLSDYLYSYPFVKANVNRNAGEDELDLYSKRTDPNNYEIKKNHPNYLGEINDFLNKDFNQVFCPWSNPSSTSNSNIAVEILHNLNGIIYVNFYTTNAVSAPPSKPQNLLMSVTTDRHPKLTWDKNLEPDMTQYKVYRSTNASTGYTQIGTAVHNPFLQTITYIDYTIDVPLNGHQAGDIKYYRVTAADNQTLESVKSDYVQVMSDEYSEEKINSGLLNNEFPKEYSLRNNYPNPFNPTTQISYSIKEEGLVTLKVYDVLGREMAAFVNENKPAAVYEVEFNAADLPSGVYIYKLQAGAFTESRKMLLMK